MPTKLNKTISRVSNSELDGGYGPDKHKPLVISIIPGGGSADLLELRPLGTRQGVQIRVVDVYAHALRCAANRRNP